MTGEGAYPVAPLGRRVCAWVIDAALGTLLAIGFVRLTGGVQDVRTLWHVMTFKSVNGPAGHDLSAAVSPAAAGLSALRPVAGLLGILVAVAAGMVAYRVVTTARWGAGIGKALLGLRVIVDIATDAEPDRPGWKRSWKRWAVPQLPGLIPLPATGLLAYLPAFRDARRRGLHDRVAGTLVVDIRARTPEPEARAAIAAPLDFPGAVASEETLSAASAATGGSAPGTTG